MQPKAKAKMKTKLNELLTGRSNSMGYGAKKAET